MNGWMDIEIKLVYMEESVCENKAMALFLPANISLKQNHPKFQQCNSSRVYVRPSKCTPIQQQVEGILCECCSGKGWLVCDFCNGQKTNVRAENNSRIYRRCPSCKAIGSILCWKCKVYKCVTFPDDDDGLELRF